MTKVGTLVDRHQDRLSVLLGADTQPGDVVQEWTLRTAAGHELVVLATLDTRSRLIAVRFESASRSLPPAALRSGGAAVVCNDGGETWIELFSGALLLRRALANWTLEEGGFQLDVALNGQRRILGFVVRPGAQMSET
ncbi:hypothetical protein GCM10009868_31080 [Terrabacter aerolatus]|uniref:Uncharacterized protein n=1 Tax=Terrabacter aerolatus TaxID=422442 RepID=A0A512D714_9MICO|nr:hypothetical protein [Terrabacter aerolatus]GEO32157.1 hypothetical protein TAE01_39670 [Terrabacter aerolatus]